MNIKEKVSDKKRKSISLTEVRSNLSCVLNKLDSVVFFTKTWCDVMGRIRKAAVNSALRASP